MDLSKYDALTLTLRSIHEGLQVLDRASETTIHLHLIAAGITIPISDPKLRAAVIHLVRTEKQQTFSRVRKELTELLSAGSANRSQNE